MYVAGAAISELKAFCSGAAYLSRKLEKKIIFKPLDRPVPELT